MTKEKEVNSGRLQGFYIARRVCPCSLFSLYKKNRPLLPSKKKVIAPHVMKGRVNTYGVTGPGSLQWDYRLILTRAMEFFCSHSKFFSFLTLREGFSSFIGELHEVLTIFCDFDCKIQLVSQKIYEKNIENSSSNLGRAGGPHFARKTVTV